MFDNRFVFVGWVATVAGLANGLPALPQTGAGAGAVAMPLPAATATLNLGKSIAIRPSADGLLYTMGQVNGVSVRFLIDTGATSVVLTPADARRAGIEPDALGWSASMRTAGGEVAMAWSRADRITVADREMQHVDVALPVADLPTSLLGLNALARLGPITIDGGHRDYRTP